MGSEVEERIVAHAWAYGHPGTITTATGDGDVAQIEVATADLIEALDEFNRILNGPDPAGPPDPGRSDVVAVDVVYAVGEAIRMLRAAAATDCAWRVETAWLAVMARDIDDIPQHVALEEQARG